MKTTTNQATETTTTRIEAGALATDPAYLARARAEGTKDGAEWAYCYEPGGPWFARAGGTPHLAAWHREWMAAFREARHAVAS